MKTKLASLAILASAICACASVPRRPAAQRSEDERTQTSVRVESSCDGDIDGGDRLGTGVIISDRHVLTAAHVVACTALPSVHVTYRRGGSLERVRMVVTRIDEAHDIARLEIASASHFAIAAAPPIVRAADPGDHVCAELPSDHYSLSMCRSVASDWSVARTMLTQPGDSGAPVFDSAGMLVGLDVDRASRVHAADEHR